jgi:SPP1 Gp6-like portal protein
MPLEQDHYRRILKWEQAQTRRLGRARLQRYWEARRYYYGENDEPDNVNQPLGIHYVPVIHQKHTHYLFGEWEKDIVNWNVSPWDGDIAHEKDVEIAEKIQRAIYRLTRRSRFNSILYKGAMNGSIYGDSVFKVAWNPYHQRTNVESILPEYFHAIWHPLDATQTLEACVAFNMDRATAHSMYKTAGTKGFLPTGSGLNPELATVWEYWSPTETVVAVDSDIILKQDNLYMNANNPQDIQPGMLPYIHIANLAIDGEYWGFGDAESALKLADELNYRMADIGDIINYHAHPITILKGFYGKVNDLPVAADAVWDMGREGEASYLEWGGPPPQMLEYLDMLLRVLLETSNLTPVAFGNITSSQASSAALNIQMLPITEVVRRKRAVWGPQLVDMIIKLLTHEDAVLKSKGSSLKRVYDFELTDLERFEIQVKWAPILPRDRLAVVNEQVALLSNHAKSIMQSLLDMDVDDPAEERDRIMKDAEELLRVEAKINMEIADHEADLQKELTEHEDKFAQADHDRTLEKTTMDMKKAAQAHSHAMKEDPTTDPERHKRHVEGIKTEHAEERKTLDTKAKTAERTAQAKIKIARVSSQRGGKNSTKAKGGSNTDGGQ